MEQEIKEKLIRETTRLSKHFRIAEPGLRFSKRMENGRYKNRMQILVLPEDAWRGIENTFVHEFAHHLTRCRTPHVKSHGAQFRMNLWRCARMFFSNPLRYAWSTEYTLVKVWYEKRKGGQNDGE